MELTTCWSTWVCSEEMVLDTLEKVGGQAVQAFITPVRLALEVGAWEAVAKAAARLVSPVASDWLSPGPPSTPFNWLNRFAMVSYCEARAAGRQLFLGEELVGDALDAGDVHAHQLAVGGQRLLVDHPAGIARRVEVGDVVRHHAERGAVGLERADGAAGDSVQAHELRSKCYFPPKLSQAPCHDGGDGFSAFPAAFHTVRSLTAARQSLPHRQLLPGCLCSAAAGCWRKIQQKAAPKHWPALCDGFAGSSSGFLRVRASATSRLAPPAGFHAARADSNTPKTDEASPFALLVGAAVAPAQKPSNTPGNASGGKGDDKSDDKTGDGKSDQATAAQTAQTQTGQTQTPQTQAAASAGNSQPPSQPANDTDQDQDSQAATDPNAAPNLPQADLNTTPPPPVTGDTQPATDAGDDIASAADSVSLWPQSARPQPQIGQAGKPDKADRTDKSGKKDVSDQPAQPDAATVTTGLLPPDLQAAAVTPPPAPQTIVPPVTDAPDQTQISAAPAIAPAAPANMPAAQPTDQIAPQDAAQTASQDAPQTAGPVAPQSQSQPPAAGAPPAQQPQLKTNSFAPASLAAAANTQPGQDGSGQPQIDPPKDGPTIAPTKGQPKPVAAKADAAIKTTKPLPGKSQQVNDPAAVKGADANTTADDTDDSDSIRNAGKSAEPATDAAAPKLAANIANTITVPPTGQPGLPQTQATDFTQHIQVTAQSHDTAPTLPALAVEIAAKSQSRRQAIRHPPRSAGTGPRRSAPFHRRHRQGQRASVRRPAPDA